MVTFNKIIQVPVDEDLLGALDELARTEGESRAALIRRACQDYLRRLHEAALDDIYEAGYRRIPEDLTLADAQAAMAAAILPEETW